MTVSKLLKCDVCGKVTKVKIEVGHIEKYSAHIPCKSCGILFHCEYKQDDEKVEMKSDFINATEIFDELADYICTVTGDFISEKVKEINSPEDEIMPPMWMKFRDMLGDEEYSKLFKKRIPILKSVNKEIQYQWARIMDLWINKQKYFFDLQMKYLYDDRSFDTNEQERLSLVRKLTTDVLSEIYFESEYEEYLETIRNNLRKLVRKYPEKFQEFLVDVNDMGLLEQSERILYEQIKRIIGYIPELIPVFSLALVDEKSKDILFNKDFSLGIYTIDFETIKLLYQDLYETNAKVLFIPVCLDNLLNRGDYNAFIDNKFKSLKKYVDEWKTFSKIDAIENNTVFAKRSKECLDNKLRNCIGHCSYEVDNIRQVITYKNGEKTLLNVAYYCYELGLATFENFCVVTLLHEILLSNKLK
ncbi:MAG: hypothetical protein E7B53_08845 [Clostridium sp.]|uniref:hypothetical protein n=1 Tax=Clostridium sp. TaxID=1506 RepID=UPI002903A920|nr:hypothetical protein [Clostridium sp.]MDU2895243.1 hypothetical protein [Clostridium sp.]MDU3007046.1 hypothetical protein [Clostridium sp.]MDU3036964.1 hypothetical protein [Clostridium sp.]MDU3051287.1 hypothetical protein [Clostridium sp.]